MSALPTPIPDATVPLKYNTGKTALAIEYWLRAIFEGPPPHEGTGYGSVGVEVQNFRMDIHGMVRLRFPKEGV